MKRITLAVVFFAFTVPCSAQTNCEGDSLVDAFQQTFSKQTGTAKKTGKRRGRGKFWKKPKPRHETATFTVPTTEGRWFLTVKRPLWPIKKRGFGWVTLNGSVVFSLAEFLFRPSPLLRKEIPVLPTNELKVLVVGGELSVRIQGVVPDAKLPGTQHTHVVERTLFTHTFVRAPRFPKKESVQVPLSLTDGLFSLRVKNGGAGWKSKVSPATSITWNGQRVVSVFDLFPHRSTAEVPIEVTDTNELRVRVLGRRGSFLTATVKGFVADPEPPRIQFSSPAAGACVGPGETLQVAFTDPESGIRHGSFQLLVNGVDVTSTARVGSNSASLRLGDLPPAVGVDGGMTFVARARDGACNLGEASLSFQYDSTPPSLSLTPQTGGVVHEEVILLVAAYSDAGCGVDTSSLKVILDGKDITSLFSVAAGQATATSPTLTEGNHTLTVTLSDSVGNQATASSTLRVETLAVAFELGLSPGDPRGVQAGTENSLTIRATTASGSTAKSFVGITRVLVSDDLIPLHDTIVPFTAADKGTVVVPRIAFFRTVGPLTVTVKSLEPPPLDIEGTLQVTTFLEGPFVFPTLPRLTNDHVVTVSGTAVPNQLVELVVDFKVVATTTADGGGLFSFTVALDEGQHDVYVRTNDPQTGEQLVSSPSVVVVDTKTATPAIFRPVSNELIANRGVVTGTAEPGALVSVFEGANLLGSVTASAQGRYSVPVTLTTGTHTIRAQARDLAGNVSAFSQTVTFRSGPSPVVVSVLNGGLPNPTPVAGVTVRVGGLSALTDAGGRVEFLAVPVGTAVVEIDGRPRLARVDLPAKVSASGVVRLGPVVLQPVPAGVRVSVPLSNGSATARTLVESTLVPHARIEVPLGTRIAPASGSAIDLAIFPVDASFTPLPFPSGFVPARLYELHQTGLTFSPGVSVRLPNDARLPAGASAPVYGLKANRGGWVHLGTATVDPTGRFLETDSPFVTSFSLLGYSSRRSLATTYRLTLLDLTGSPLTGSSPYFVAAPTVFGQSLAEVRSGVWELATPAVASEIPVRALVQVRLPGMVSPASLSFATNPVLPTPSVTVLHGSSFTPRLRFSCSVATAGGATGSSGTNDPSVPALAITDTVVNHDLGSVETQVAPITTTTFVGFSGLLNKSFGVGAPPTFSHSAPGVSFARLPPGTSTTPNTNRFLPFVVSLEDGDADYTTSPPTYTQTARLVSVEYSLNGGPFRPADLLAGDPSTPLSAPPGGAPYLYVWDTQGALNPIGVATSPQSVVLRTTVEDEAGGNRRARVSQPFVLQYQGPGVAAVDPASGAVGVPRHKQIVLTFNEPMDPATVNATSVQLHQGTTVLPATVTYDALAQAATIAPVSSLPWGQLLTVTASTAIRNQSGVSFPSSFSSQFRVARQLVVASVDPPDGATGVFVDTTVRVAFAEQLDPTTVTSNSVQLCNGVQPITTATVAYVDSTSTVEISIAGRLPTDVTLTVKVTTDVRSVIGSLLPVDFASSFQTGSVVGTDDQDGDGLLNFEELALGTDPNDPDTDDDGLTDFVEVNGVPPTNPTSNDTDQDGLLDGSDPVPAGAPVDPPPDGAIPSAAVILSDAKGPRDWERGLNHGYETSEGTRTGDEGLAIFLSQPVPISSLDLEIKAPAGSSLAVTSVRYYVSFSQGQASYEALLTSPPSHGGHGRNTYLALSSDLGQTGGTAWGRLQVNHALVSTPVYDPGASKLVTETVATVASPTYALKGGGTVTYRVDKFDPSTNKTTTILNLGTLRVHGVLLLGIRGAILDPRALNGQGVTVDITQANQSIGRHTLFAEPTGYNLPELPQLLEPVSVQGLGVNTLSGEIHHSVSLFSCKGPGLSFDMGLRYRSSGSAYWAATAGRPDRAELVYAPFGHGWSSLYTLRILKESWKDRDASGSLATKTGMFLLQDANGTTVPFRFDAAGNGNFETGGTTRFPHGSRQENQGVLSPTFGVTYRDLLVSRTTNGGFRVGSNYSPLVATFDAGGRLVEVRRRDHGRPIKLVHTTNQVKFTDAQGRTMRWELSNDLVTRVTDPAGRSWSFSYVGHSLITISHSSGQRTFRFGYAATTYQLTHATDPTGLITRLTYRTPTGSPQSQPWHFYYPGASIARVQEDTARLTFNYRQPTASGVWKVTVEDALTPPRRTTHDFNLNSGGTKPPVVWESSLGSWSRKLTLDKALPASTEHLPKTATEFSSWKLNIPSRFISVLTPHEVFIRRRDGTFASEQRAGNGFWTVKDVYPYAATAFVTSSVSYSHVTKPNAEGLVRTIQSPEVKTTLPAGQATVSLDYNADGDLVQFVDSLGQITSSVPTTVAGKLGLVTERRLVNRFPGRSDASERFEYDAIGNVTKHTDPEGAATVFVYDGFNQLTELRFSDGSRITNEYDRAGRLTRRRASQGGFVEYILDQRGLLKQEIQSATGPQGTTYTRNANGEVTKITAPRGATTDLEYDDRGRVKKVVLQPLGRTLHFTRDARGNVTKERRVERDSTEFVTDYAYDPMDRVTRIRLPEIDQGGTRWRPEIRYVYTARGQVKREEYDTAPGTPPKTEVVDYVYDPVGRVIRICRGILDLNRNLECKAVEEVTYDIAGNMIEYKGPDFRFFFGQTRPRTTIPRPSRGVELDGLGRPNRINDSKGQPLAQVVRDRAGRVKEISMPDSGGTMRIVERRIYDPVTGLLKEVLGFYGDRRRYQYDAQGRPIRVTDSLGTVTEVTYDSEGRIQRVQTRGADGAFAAREMEYFATGELKKQVQVVGTSRFETSYLYDNQARLTQVTNPLGKATRFVYDAKGRLLERKTPLSTLRYSYDAWGRVVQEQAIGGETVSFGYDAANRTTRVENSRYRRSVVYDDVGRESSITWRDKLRSTDRTFWQLYDPDWGQLVEVVDPEGLVTRYSHVDDRQFPPGLPPTGSQRIKIEQGQTGSPSFSEVAQFTFDRAGRPVQRTTPGGLQINRVYNAVGDITQQSGTAHNIAYQYDVLGRRTQATYSQLAVVRSWSYDGLGRLTRELIKKSGIPVHDERVVFDEAGNRSQQWQNGVFRAFSYNGFNQLLSVLFVEPLLVPSATLTASADSTLDANHAPSLVLDGVVSSGTGAGESFVSQTSAQDHWLEIRSANFLFVNAVELRLPETRGLPTELRLEYEEVPAGQWKPLAPATLLGAGSTPQATGIAPLSSRVVASFGSVRTRAIRIVQPTGGAPQPTGPLGNALAVSEVRLFQGRQSGTTFTYDDNGNMTQAGGRTYAYDKRDRLIGVTEPGVVNMALNQGPLGRVLGVTDNLASSTSQFLYLGAERYAVYDGSQVLQRKYLQSPVIDQKIGVVPYVGGTAQSARLFVSTNKGSTHLVTDTSARVLETHLTSAWGEPLSGSLGQPAPTLTQFGFDGRPRLGNSGLLDFRARVYDPKLSRFLTTDPAGTQDGLNRYAFVIGDPVNHVDRDGRLFGADNLIAGGVGVLVGWGTAKLTGQRYTMKDAATDFTVGFASNGLSVLAKAGKLGKTLEALSTGNRVQRATARTVTVGGSLGVAVAGDYASARVKGQNFDLKASAGTQIALRAGGRLVGALYRKLRPAVGASLAKWINRTDPACFLAGTLVKTRSGHKKIEEIKVGDEVLSRDEATGEQGYKRVVRLFRGHTDQVVYLRIAKAPSTQRGRSESHRVGEASGGSEESDEPPLPDDDTQTLRCTTEHPFWVVGRGWVTSGKLKVGDQLVGSKGEALVVVGHEIRAEEAEHFNFHVEGWNTYFVAERESDPFVWVHNKGGDVGFGVAGSSGRIGTARQWLLSPIRTARVLGRVKAHRQALLQRMAQRVGHTGPVRYQHGARGFGGGRTGPHGQIIMDAQAWGTRGVRAEKVLFHEIGHRHDPTLMGMWRDASMSVGAQRGGILGAAQRYGDSAVGNARASYHGSTLPNMRPWERTMMLDDAIGRLFPR